MLRTAITSQDRVGHQTVMNLRQFSMLNGVFRRRAYRTSGRAICSLFESMGVVEFASIQDSQFVLPRTLEPREVRQHRLDRFEPVQ